MQRVSTDPAAVAAAIAACDDLDDAARICKLHRIHHSVNAGVLTIGHAWLHGCICWSLDGWQWPDNSKVDGRLKPSTNNAITVVSRYMR